MPDSVRASPDRLSGAFSTVAPEVISLKGALPASDIWSLGATIVELIDGAPPYSGLVAMSAMFRIVEDPEGPPIPDRCSSELHAFLKRCFKKDPKERPTAEELSSDPWLTKHFDLSLVSSAFSDLPVDDAYASFPAPAGHAPARLAPLHAPHLVRPAPHCANRPDALARGRPRRIPCRAQAAGATVRGERAARQDVVRLGLLGGRRARHCACSRSSGAPTS